MLELKLYPYAEEALREAHTKILALHGDKDPSLASIEANQVDSTWLAPRDWHHVT